MRAILLIIFLSFQAQAMNWGHLLTGTTDTLEKKQITAGLLIAGYGITDDITIGSSPFIHFGYQMYSLIGRARIYNGEHYDLGLDFYYFDSMKNGQNSNYDQTSTFLKVNNDFTINKYFRISSTLGVQYFIKDNSTFSLRSDPLGRYRSFNVKDYVDWYYEDKLQDYKENPRTPYTVSFSVLPTVYLTDHFFVNLEAGVLGLNYEYPLSHVGWSLNYQGKRFDIGLGASISSRTTPDLGKQTLIHQEIKLQLYL